VKSIKNKLLDIIKRLQIAEEICYRSDPSKVDGERSYSYAVGYSKVCMMRASEDLSKIINELTNDPR